jgi:MgsA AAA+ ATPase C terminal
MRDVFGEATQWLTREVDSSLATPTEPIAADPWLISSLLQKSIRRSETEIARRAAVTLLQLKGAAIWRRLIVIAFEDIGIGSVDAVAMTVAAADDSAWRKSHGGDIRLAVAMAGILAEAPKDRSADYLVGAKDHPLLAGFAQEMVSASLPTRLSRIGSRALDLPHRAVAALLASGITTRNGDRHAILSAFHNLGVPESLVVATSIAAAKTREAITAMVPLIWLAARESKRQVCNYPVPPRVDAVEMPLYALDMHTRLGREAIWRFTRENTEVRSCLARCVPEPCWRRAAYVMAFYVDGGPIARRLLWDQSEALEAFGIERDLLHAGVPAEGIQPLLAAMRANLEHLNELRAQVLANFQATQASRTIEP